MLTVFKSHSKIAVLHSEKTVPLSARISPLAKELIALERAETQESEGAVVDRCVIQCLIRSKRGRKLARKYILDDPLAKAIFDACSAADAENHQKTP